MKPLVTVALPTWRSQHILWLALSGLANQEDAPPWELVVDACDWGESEAIVTGRARKLYAAGCVDISVTTNYEDKVPLGAKWRVMAQSVAKGEVFVLCASDNYSPPNRLAHSYEVIANGGYDWMDVSEGLFYDISSGKRATWHRPDPDTTGLWMATRTEYMADLDGDGPKKGIDGWMRSQIPRSNWARIDEPMQGLHTDGCNTISKHRAARYDDKRWFGQPTQKIQRVLPPEVYKRLMEMRIL